jgi:CRP-like cAMP-binding protein
MISRTAAGLHANRLLGLLPRRDCAQLHPYLQRVQLDYRQSLYRANRPIEYVYFIETGVGSLVNTMANGDAAEVGTIGNEGVVGLPLLLGDDRAPTSVYVQVPGAGLRMKAVRFKNAGGDASLCPRLLQPDRAVCRMQSLSYPGATMLPQALDGARPHALE